MPDSLSMMAIKEEVFNGFIEIEETTLLSFDSHTNFF
jgi:hypothetical protein